jgi:hypothetical protein
MGQLGRQGGWFSNLLPERTASMLGLMNLFSAIARLTRSINRSADLFDAANEGLAKQLAVGPEIEPEAPALTNGHGRAPNGRKTVAARE